MSAVWKLKKMMMYKCDYILHKLIILEQVNFENKSKQKLELSK